MPANYYIIYFSKAASLLNEGELLHLLTRARHRNQGLGITGLLLYKESKVNGKAHGQFIQLQEGDKNAVELIYSSIQNDHRHEQLMILKKGESYKRFFTDWSMGFAALAEAPYHELPGFFDLSEKNLNSLSSSHEHPALTLFQAFYETVKG